MEKLEKNSKGVKREISQSLGRFILELRSREKCLFEKVDALVAMESKDMGKVCQTIKFTNGDENVMLSAIRKFGVVFAHPQPPLWGDLAPEGFPRGTTGGLRTSDSLLDQPWETDESSSTDSDSITVSDETVSLSDQSRETDESSSTDSDSFTESDETEMKHLSDTIVMFPQRCLSKCKKVYQGEILSRVLSNRQCAIKFPQETDQSNKEVKILEKLGMHTHVISLIQSGVVDSIFNERFLVLELCCKDNLNQYLTNTSYNLQLSLRYCIQIVIGMKYIHDKCIIHKDLKPSNILLTLDQQYIKIADFGISQEIKSKRSMVFCEYRFGTVGYRPPESFGNAYISLKSDIFSLGSLFHYIMTYGKSSFGPEQDLRDSNVIKGNVRIAHLLVPNPNTFSHLFKLMMSKERRYRPTIWQIEDHPCWRLEEHDCKFDYGCVDEIDDSSDERAHSPQIEVVEPIDEFTILSEMLEILEPEEERIHNNKVRSSLPGNVQGLSSPVYGAPTPPPKPALPGSNQATVNRNRGRTVAPGPNLREHKRASSDTRATVSPTQSSFLTDQRRNAKVMTEQENLYRALPPLPPHNPPAATAPMARGPPLQHPLATHRPLPAPVPSREPKRDSFGESSGKGGTKNILMKTYSNLKSRWKSRSPSKNVIGKLPNVLSAGAAPPGLPDKMAQRELPPPSLPRSRRVKAIYNCEADNPDELTFVEDEIILITGVEDQEWWIGHIEHQPRRAGVFPASFVENLPD